MTMKVAMIYGVIRVEESNKEPSRQESSGSSSEEEIPLPELPGIDAWLMDEDKEVD